jgi:hypothetical protein
VLGGKGLAENEREAGAKTDIKSAHAPCLPILKRLLRNLAMTRILGVYSLYLSFYQSAKSLLDSLNRFFIQAEQRI